MPRGISRDSNSLPHRCQQCRTAHTQTRELADHNAPWRFRPTCLAVHLSSCPWRVPREALKASNGTANPQCAALLPLGMQATSDVCEHLWSRLLKLCDWIGDMHDVRSHRMLVAKLSRRAWRRSLATRAAGEDTPHYSAYARGARVSAHSALGRLRAVSQGAQGARSLHARWPLCARRRRYAALHVNWPLPIREGVAYREFGLCAQCHHAHVDNVEKLHVGVPRLPVATCAARLVRRTARAPHPLPWR